MDSGATVLVPSVDRARGYRGLAGGRVGIHPLRAGAALPQPPGRECALVVVTGSAVRCDETLAPGDGVYLPSGGDCGLRAASAETRILVVHGEKAGSGEVVGWKYAAARQADGGVLAGVGGFSGMGVRWLVTSATVGSAGVVVATSVFQPGGRHEPHRHPHAAEFFLLVYGSGEHCAPRGPIRLRAGDLVFVPAGEWHGYRTDPGTVTRAIYGYLGAGSLEAAGYELDRKEAGTCARPS
ncbi:MAG TPA: cupin domain-containing protein [Amycolatopsis sp.]|nr:cupin domain-containing protein [Amycolatopsis sp.]